VQMAAVSVLLLGMWHPAGYCLLWAAMIVTVVSGVDYFWKNRGVFGNKANS